MRLNVFPALDVIIIESDFCGPLEFWIKWHLCIRIEIHLKSIQMSFMVER